MILITETLKDERFGVVSGSTYWLYLWWKVHIPFEALGNRIFRRRKVIRPSSSWELCFADGRIVWFAEPVIENRISISAFFPWDFMSSSWSFQLWGITFDFNSWSALRLSWILIVESKFWSTPNSTKSATCNPSQFACSAHRPGWKDILWLPNLYTLAISTPCGSQSTKISIGTCRWSMSTFSDNLLLDYQYQLNLCPWS